MAVGGTGAQSDWQTAASAGRGRTRREKVSRRRKGGVRIRRRCRGKGVREKDRRREVNEESGEVGGGIVKIGRRKEIGKRRKSSDGEMER